MEHERWNHFEEKWNMHREHVLQQALALPAEDRAYVASALEHSLCANDSTLSDEGFESKDGPQTSADELRLELQRRSERFRAGLTSARPAVELLADLTQRQAEESKT
ncbi:MAG: hypothetical protein ACKV0T_03340 [Planctomycetales bacterium]